MKTELPNGWYECKAPYDHIYLGVFDGQYMFKFHNGELPGTKILDRTVTAPHYLPDINLLQTISIDVFKMQADIEIARNRISYQNSFCSYYEDSPWLIPKGKKLKLNSDNDIEKVAPTEDYSFLEIH